MLEPLPITDAVCIAAPELSWEAVRASGPGGQNVNKVASKVVLRFDLAGSPSLPPEVKERLVRLAGHRVDAAGMLVLSSQRTRDQHQNLEDARRKLADLVRQALIAPRPRRPTRPGRGAVERRITEKKQRGMQKRERQGRGED